MTSERGAVVVGSGPNGLAAAIALAQRGRRVTIVEGAPTIGGGIRSDALTLPGFTHDVCSSVYPFAAASPFFRSLPLGRHGLEWVTPPVAVAHPFDDGTAVFATRSVDETAAGLGEDGDAYRRLVGPLVEDAGLILRHLLGPVRLPPALLPFARFAYHGLQPATWLLRRRFRGEPARALLAGCAAHALVPLDAPATASFGLILAMAAHLNGWPFARGGAQSLADALAGVLREHGGRVVTGTWARTLADVEALRAEAGGGPALLDVSPWGLLEMARGALPEPYTRKLRRYRQGGGVVKVDYALDGPVPWTAEVCARAGTLHLGGTMDEIVAGEAAVLAGGVPDRPFVLCAQPSMFDPTRAPEGKHTVWAYCHVPAGWTEDESPKIDAQIERFAPGFASRILARTVMLPKDLEAHNPNLLGGDIGTGSQDLGQLLFRPFITTNPYATPLDDVYLCSAATPPGSGVHGMSGYRAALAALATTHDEPLRSRLTRRLP